MAYELTITPLARTCSGEHYRVAAQLGGAAASFVAHPDDPAPDASDVAEALEVVARAMLARLPDRRRDAVSTALGRKQFELDPTLGGTVRLSR